MIVLGATGIVVALCLAYFAGDWFVGHRHPEHGSDVRAWCEGCGSEFTALYDGSTCPDCGRSLKTTDEADNAG